MPELPDIEIYRRCLSHRIAGATLHRIIIKSPSLLRTVEPPPEAIEGAAILGVERLGKRIVLACSGEHFIVIHLMIAGRLLWKPPATNPASKIDAAALKFDAGTLEAIRKPRNRWCAGRE